MLLALDETLKLISEGRLLHIAGDENLLLKLPLGEFIAGTIPYFIGQDGGAFSKDKLFVTEIDVGTNYKVCTYDRNSIKNITADCFENGFTMLIIPYQSDVHYEYANTVATIPDIFMHNIIGWISGFDLAIVPNDLAKVLDGTTGGMYTDTAVALHVQLPDGKLANIGIINIFEQDKDSPVIKFPTQGFRVRECYIGGEQVILSEYIAKNKIDTRFPIIANYSGSVVNVAIKEIIGDIVIVAAPVFDGMEYKFAKPIADYHAAITDSIYDDIPRPFFSLNCCFNYTYGQLEGGKIGNFIGPMTFGEIAYILVNQTLVYLEIV